MSEGTAPPPPPIVGGPESRIESWIAGRPTAADEAFEARSPSTGEVIAQVGRATTDLVDLAVDAAGAAFLEHRRESAFVRAGWCQSAATAIRAHSDFLGRELAREHGKPLAEASAEVLSAADGFDLAAREVLAADGDIPVVRDPNKRVLVRREPLGVWAVITPWNFPLNIPVEYLGPALSTGNAVVWKPAPTTARVAALFHRILVDSSDLPGDLLQLVLTDETKVAQHLVTHPGVVAVGFTGGSATGKAIARAAWDKHLLLELGGNSPVVVLDDAPIEHVARAVASSAFFNAGQVCSAAGRILAPAATAAVLAEAIADHAAALRLGDPLADTTTIGPVHLESGAKRVRSHVKDAISRGARLLTGGDAVSGHATRQFFEPTVLADVPVDAVGFEEETFGPVAAVTSFEDDESLLAAANSGRYGLVGSLFTTRLDRAIDIAERIDVGMVVVNDTSNYWELNLPFGGAPGRDSGRGRLGGKYALAEFTQAKSIVLDIRA
ncbi:aldehyde dehydrogenase family protein [Streptomyces sp. NPDC057257]|uniref:aldehyde dehydrogenase family protein n=1 Tax=Streptomyces sp. NPDC057257 TaxID=3346071 RepID=UPI0036404EEF